MKKILLFLFVLSVFGCKKKNTQNRVIENFKLDESFGAYISEYTTGTVSVDSKLSVRFSNIVIQHSDINTVVDESIFKISPSVKGKAIWQSENLLVFTPEERFEYDENYEYSVNIGQLYKDVPSDKKTAKFSFHSGALDYSISFNNISYPANEDAPLSIKGNITSSEFVEKEKIEELISAKIGRQKQDIEWNHHTSRSHYFTINNVSRKEDESIVSFVWKDKNHNTKFEGKKDITIHPIGVFQVFSSEVSNTSGGEIKVNFTSKLDKRQALEGLVRIDGYKGKLKYDISDSQLSIYPKGKVKSPFQLTIDKSILSENGRSMKIDYSINHSFAPIEPKVRLLGKGVVVPNNEEVIFPFEAINLKGVTVEVFKIFEDNVLQFLQNGNLNYDYNLSPVGRIVHQQKVDLPSLNSESNDAEFVRYALDLQRMITPDPGAIYRVRIGFEKSDVVSFPCKDEDEVVSQVLSTRDGFTSIMDNNRRYSSYRWEDRNDPCKPAYYRRHNFISRNVLASNIGIIVKKGNNKSLDLFLSDLKTVEPINGASAEVYDYQQQKIGEGFSDTDGMIAMENIKSASFVIIKNGNEFGYINIQDRQANSLSEFDVSGRSKKKGIDGFIYGERGVWRPGDTIFLNFMLDDVAHKLPKNHPVSLTIKDSRGKQKYEKTVTGHVGQIYDFPVATSENDPTGNWTATIKVGGSSFQKILKVETIKPNRLKINFDVEDGDIDMTRMLEVPFSSQWLHGAPAGPLKAKVDVKFSAVTTKFSGYNKYEFDDPARKIGTSSFSVFDTNLKEDGTANITYKPTKDWKPAGKVKVDFKTKVFEKGGNFSEDNLTKGADFYKSYIGVNVPKSRWGGKFIKINDDSKIEIVSLDKDGKPVPNKKLSVGLYNANWSWWYDRGYSEKYRYNTSSHNGAIKKEKITTNAKGEAEYPVKFSDYGNYMVRICDEESGHCTGDMFYVGHSWGRAKDREGPQQLKFSTDKIKYDVGENIEVKIPSSAGSRILISIENNERVLDAFWVDGKTDETKIDIPTRAEMNSNIYIHAHLIQPHNNGANDLPMRMFGVVPVSVVDPNSEIHPVIDMAESIRPNEKYSIKVSEEKGLPMAYTIAVVDEGLLDLTRFKTPDSWAFFYAKKALGVMTWDIYDMVLDGYGGKIDQLISIGGDLGITNKGSKKASRFVPVVKHLGPFYLNPGEEKVHQLNMPNYVGSVRTMVVAKNDDAYGSAEKTSFVKKPLMVLATLPRVLGPNESFSLPANVFAMENNITDVKVSVEASDNLSIVNGKESRLAFDKRGDKQAYFDMKVGHSIGTANVKIRAQGNGEGAFDEVNIEVRNPNPFTSKVYEASIQPGENWTKEYLPFGTGGTNEGVLEISNMPSINLSKRMRYLIRYPYGCLEQTTSAIFPQLFLEEIVELSQGQKMKIDNHITKAITKLAKFQLPNGGLGYWQGANDANEWGTNYAGHFMLEAKDKGYHVPSYVLDNLINFQNNKANNEDLSDKGSKVKTQAYRLYFLAKAGVANIGAMNRLRKNSYLDVTSGHILAVAYALIGQKDIASELIANKDYNLSTYRETGGTYGSDLRDLSMIVEAQLAIGDKVEATKLVKKISERLGSAKWYSTQSTAYALLSVGKFFKSYEKDDLKYSFKTSGSQLESGVTVKSTVQKDIEVQDEGLQSVFVQNDSKAIIYVRYVLSGQLPPGEEEPASNKHISLSVSYVDEDGKKMDPASIKQGTDFTAIVSVKNLMSKGRLIEEVALTQIFPSGWEVQNERMSVVNEETSSNYEHREIRDDRVYTFFDLKRDVSTFRLKLNATYAGRFYLSPVYAEAMYDNDIQAKTQGQWVEVVK